MKPIKFVLLAVCLTAVFALTGCKLSGGGSNSGGSSYDGSNSAGSGPVFPSSDGSGGTGVLGGGAGGSGAGSHTPEPATIALVGSGLLGYALLRRKRKRR